MLSIDLLFSLFWTDFLFIGRGLLSTFNLFSWDWRAFSIPSFYASFICLASLAETSRFWFLALYLTDSLLIRTFLMIWSFCSRRIGLWLWMPLVAYYDNLLFCRLAKTLSEVLWLFRPVWFLAVSPSDFSPPSLLTFFKF